MGCDIHSRAERCVNGEWQVIPGLRPFMSARSYRWWGFLADVRNSSAIEPISQPRGLPAGAVAPVNDGRPAEETANDEFIHSYSWLSVDELLKIDYDKLVEDRRFSGKIDGKSSGEFTCAPGMGKRMTLREFLQPHFFDELAALQEAGAERIVFGFAD